MYLVIGNSPRKVELKDLNDYVYYKQQKVYSEEQYKRSIDLQRAIQSKVLIVLKKTEDTTGSFDIPSVAIPSEITINNRNDDSKSTDILLDRIHKLEEMLEKNNNSDQAKIQEKTLESQLLEKLIDRIEKLESSPAPTVDNSTLNSIQESISKLESKIQEKSKGDDILDRLEGIISNAGTGSVSKVNHEDTVERRVEDIYVPNVTVEDANSHIKLEVRSIESGDSVSDSLKKLKELRSKSK